MDGPPPLHPPAFSRAASSSPTAPCPPARHTRSQSVQPPSAWGPAGWRCPSTPPRTRGATRVRARGKQRKGWADPRPAWFWVQRRRLVRWHSAMCRPGLTAGRRTPWLPPLPGSSRACPGTRHNLQPLPAAPLRLPAALFLLPPAGHGRALLEAIEDMCRALGIPRILLCSTGGRRGAPSAGPLPPPSRGSSLRGRHAPGFSSLPALVSARALPPHPACRAGRPGPSTHSPAGLPLPPQTTLAPRRRGSGLASRSSRKRSCRRAGQQQQQQQQQDTCQLNPAPAACLWCPCSSRHRCHQRGAACSRLNGAACLPASPPSAAAGRDAPRPAAHGQHCAGGWGWWVGGWGVGGPLHCAFHAPGRTGVRARRMPQQPCRPSCAQWHVVRRACSARPPGSPPSRARMAPHAACSLSAPLGVFHWVQMVKEVPQPVPWKSLMLRHGDLKQRLYYPPDRCGIGGGWWVGGLASRVGVAP